MPAFDASFGFSLCGSISFTMGKSVHQIGRGVAMKTMLSTVIMIFATSLAVHAQYKPGSVEDKLIQLDKAWTAAELKGDTKAAGALIAHDYMGTTQRGVIETRDQYLAGIAANADMVESDDYKVTIYDKTAIMTHRATVKGVRNMQFRSTHVWIKRKGEWKIVAHHGSQITSPDDGAAEDDM
jgi:hypothetical protein